jgi:hypothetical protein
MGKLLMPATVVQTVATGLSQVSQSQTTLRQCDSCPYPFRDRAPTVALSQGSYWCRKRSVAKQRAAALPIASMGWRFRARPRPGEMTGPDQKIPRLQINVSSWSICKRVPQRGLPLAPVAPCDRSHSAIRTETKIWKRTIAFQACGRAQHVEQSSKLEFKQSASNLTGGDAGLKI